MEDIMSYTRKFYMSTNGTNLQNLTKIQLFLYRLQKKNNLSEEDYYRLTPLLPVPHLCTGYPKHTNLATL